MLSNLEKRLLRTKLAQSQYGLGSLPSRHFFDSQTPLRAFSQKPQKQQSAQDDGADDSGKFSSLRKTATNKSSFHKLQENFIAQVASKKRHRKLPSIYRTPLSPELRIAALREKLGRYPLLTKEIGMIRCTYKFRKSTREERHLQNFYFQLLRKVHGKSAESRRYLAKRKAKRRALHDRIESHAANINAMASRDWQREAEEGGEVLFSDTEGEDNQTDFLFTSDEETAYTDDTEQEEEEPHERWTRMMRGFGALLFPIMVSAGLGAYLAHLHGRKPPQAWFWGSDKQPEIGPTELKRNELKGRCKAVQYPGNEPCQDRLACQQIKTKKGTGIYAAIFDGNSGWQLADSCSKKLHQYIEQNLAKAGGTSDDQVKEAIERAFEEMEESWLEVAKATFDKGFPQTAYVSSTALVVLIFNNKLFVANCGDSKAILLSQSGKNGPLKQVNLSSAFTANKKSERDRLQKAFPGEKDVFQCLKQPNGVECYVKGGLQPTRSFGDFRLKMRQFNFHNYSEQMGYRLPIPVYSGPYISPKPDIRVRELGPDDRYIILATDGLWDNFPKKQTVELVEEQLKATKDSNQSKDTKQPQQVTHDGQMIIRALLNQSIARAAKNSGVTTEYLTGLKAGPVKRQIIDDVTIMVIDLENQAIAEQS